MTVIVHYPTEYLNHIIMHTPAYVQCAHYESIEVTRLVKVTSVTQPSQQVYSEVFDALPKGESTIIIMKKATVTK